MGCIEFGKLGNSSVLSPRRFLSMHSWLHTWTTVTLFCLASSSTSQIVFAAARFIFRIPKFDHILSALFHLHWLPVVYRVQFKLLLLVYKTLNNQVPQYMKDFLPALRLLCLITCTPVTKGLLIVPRTNCKTFGGRAFVHSGPFLWNLFNLAYKLP